MRALAEFIMRGRMQAALVAFFGSLLPLISPAAVSLVTLSKGLSEGALIALWALLPLLVVFYISDFNVMVTLSSIVGVLGVMAASELLRLSTSWSRTLFFVVAFSGIAAVALDFLFAEQTNAFELVVAELFREVQQQQENAFIPGRSFLLGVIGYVIALTSVICLVLGRWWQAILYNPGGFQAEFHQLRFGVVPAVILLAGMLASDFASQEFASWAGLLGLPLLLVGIALVHYSGFLPIGSSLVGYFLCGALYCESTEFGAGRVRISRQYFEYTLTIGKAPLGY